MNHNNYEMYQLQLPRVSCWTLQTPADVEEAFKLVIADEEHAYRRDHRSRASEPYFPLLNTKALLFDSTESRAYWEERREDRWGVAGPAQHYEAFSLNHSILTSTNGQALITSLIAPANWPEFLLRPIIHPLP